MVVRLTALLFIRTKGVSFSSIYLTLIHFFLSNECLLKLQDNFGHVLYAFRNQDNI